MHLVAIQCNISFLRVERGGRGEKVGLRVGEGVKREGGRRRKGSGENKEEEENKKNNGEKVEKKRCALGEEERRGLFWGRQGRGEERK